MMTKVKLEHIYIANVGAAVAKVALRRHLVACGGAAEVTVHE